MGPHSFKCGKPKNHPRDERQSKASMGPHSFKCGKILNRQSQTPPPSLQWGRTLSSAERLFVGHRSFGPLIASMGPHSFKCGKMSWIIEMCKICPKLQWGRTLSSAESQPSPSDTRLIRHASMGPHSFKCGKVDEDGREVEGVERFNGAALFQVRKAVHSTACRRMPAVLQWGRTLSSAESQVTLSLRMDSATASMGPHSFKCGKLRAQTEDNQQEEASMGPHSFKCGKSKSPIQLGRCAGQASMGPHSFKCGKGP